MLSEKLKAILRSRTDFTEEEIVKINESEGWALIYALDKGVRELKKANTLPEICFTGFGKSDKERLSNIAIQSNFSVKDLVTKGLKILVTGENAGDSKIEKARSQGCVVTDERGFLEYIESLKVPE